VDIDRIIALIEGKSPILRIPLEVEDVLESPQFYRVEVNPLPPTLASGKSGRILNLSTIARRATTDLPAYSGIEISDCTYGPEGVFLTIKKEAPDLVPYVAGTRGTLPVRLGLDPDNQSVEIDLAKAPHLLAAGETGSGKSVFINNLILSLLENNTPDELRMLMVDPKRVELSAYQRIGHLLAPIIHEGEKAVDAFKWLVQQMELRYEKMAGQGARDVSKTDLPRIVVVVDEMADLILSEKDVEEVLVRLAQKGRAAGIHLVLATQYPTRNVVTGLIKANMPVRVSFRLAQGYNSRVVLDRKGAEKLYGKGDGLLLLNGELVRFQGAMATDKQIGLIACRARKQYAQWNPEVRADRETEFVEKLVNILEHVDIYKGK
jgi:S-DNA-T family DNA segregation ATPase FtsK/SpoIIIE